MQYLNLILVVTSIEMSVNRNLVFGDVFAFLFAKTLTKTITKIVYFKNHKLISPDQKTFKNFRCWNYLKYFHIMIKCLLFS